ncbi:zf-HC2 domain-containing protein [Caldalkalibacillus salinus]|uniref:zf-HC2 domain-containing protein n=1 Tax=Caldalkalibacillus salinus TaxID=2803787 RepID=UPI0019232259|nr:zf-HC2 domain-containing protein [Caldalkalibacillus salinus]
MKEIKCTIIQDVLPLYLDKVVSQDTKEMVEDHLQHCDKCQKEYESMKRELCIPVETEVSFFNNIRKKWFKKKVMISVLSIIITAAILLGSFSYVFHYETVIPYSEDLFKIEVQNDKQLVIRYIGKAYGGYYQAGPMSVEIDGEKKNVYIIYYTKTIADSPERKNLINTEKNSEEQEGYTSDLEIGKIDAVYYVGYDSKKIAEGKDSWDSVLERAELIWEK